MNIFQAQHQQLAALAAASKSKSLGSPLNALMSEIEAENLAANFDDSLSCLGVDVATQQGYSMSEVELPFLDQLSK